MTELERTLANQLLVLAEERYLLAFGWTKVGKGEHEAKWTYNGPEGERRRKWTNITQSHAINAQKVVAREHRFQRDHKRAYEAAERELGNPKGATE